MEKAINISPSAELSEFFTFFYQEQTGYVYTPTKVPETGEWDQAFFEWPKEKSQLIAHVLQNTPNKEVYFAPALFTTTSAKKEYFKGSYVLWVEFDGNAPQSWDDLPTPSLRVRSSEKGHEHVYWKFDYLEVDANKIEDANRALAYKLNSDTSGWDINQVLRPIGTLNHKREIPSKVQILTRTSHTVSIEIFDSIERPVETVAPFNIEDVPEALTVIAKYPFEDEVFHFFRKTAKDIPVGSRSSALMRMGFYCAEMKMSDVEAFSILNNFDQRLGKFAKRNDRVQRLSDIINKARQKFPLIDDDIHVDELPVFNYTEFMDHEITIEWVIPGILQKAGSGLLTGPPGTGKTQMLLRLAMAMATGKEFMGWEITRPHKIVIFSLEMGHADIKHFMDIMATTHSEEDVVLLTENLIIVPLGYPLLLDTPVDQAKVNRVLNLHTPDGVFFDSLGSSTNDELSEKVTKTIFDYIDKIRMHRGVFTWFIHHNRKAQINNKKPNKLSDVYGSQYVTSRPTTVIGIYPMKNNVVAVTGLKVRLSKAFTEFLAVRDDNLLFTRVNDAALSERLVAMAEDADDDGEDDDGGNDPGPTGTRFDM